MNDRSFDAAQRFLLAAKGQWTTSMYSQLRKEYEAKCQELGAQPKTVSEVAEISEGLTLYQFFAWFERHLQIAKYAGRYGLVPYYAERRETVLKAIDTVPPDDPIVELHPEMKMPLYYEATDIHQHPGGVWSDDTAGLVYEHGARSTTPLLGAAHGDLHYRLTDEIGSTGKPTRVLDMGCGFGKSTLPFADRFRDAQVVGVDLAAPCLRVAGHNARANDLTSVRFKQANAVETGLESSSFDLVTSTMFLHELPPKVIERVLEEAFRVLQPGGRMVHLDFWHFPDAFSRFMHYGHGRRNNEPYMQPLAELDLPGLMKQKGFTEIEIRPFKESPTADANDTSAWRFPWTYISARKK
jgi:ubiquinone/menaquinone biosynthesis C-methylase UbiE